MDDKVYVDAALPEPFTILGLRLRPLSIGHLILLHRLESPFVVSEAPGALSIGDLALACLICSQNYAQGVELLDQEDLAKQLFKWGLTATRQHGWRILCPWLYQPIKLEEKFGLFSEYLKYHMEVPCYSMADSGKSRSVEAPAWQVIRVVLLSKMNLTDAEIMDRPYRLCMTDFLTLRAIEGQLDLYDANELEEAQALANQLAERLKKDIPKG